jgi:hypothetical protein
VGRGRAVVKKNEHLMLVGSGETSRSKIEPRKSKRQKELPVDRLCSLSQSDI